MARILLCVGGGISAYKAPNLVREFVGRGHEVQVLMTEAAGAFVTELALTTVSKRPVRRTLLDAAAEGSVGHIDLADWAEHVVVAPATANLMARAAQGMADDLVTTVLLATRAPISWAPAMNTNMWQHPATRENLARLVARGGHFIGPDAGDLACGWIGEGRMMDPELIVDAVERWRAETSPGAWAGRHLLVSTGPTRAYLDPVRFVSNASTGAMGVAIAQAALDLGAAVTLVAGPLQVPGPRGARLRRVDVETAGEMLAAMRERLGAEPVDAVAMVAAVADFAPAEAAGAKLDKDATLAGFSEMAWTREPDILATLCAERSAAGKDAPFFLGFAAQTVDAESATEREAALVAYAREKLSRKGADAIFVNRVGVAGTGFGSPTNAGWWVDGEEVVGSGPTRPKAELGRWLVERIGAALGGQRGRAAS